METQAGKSIQLAVWFAAILLIVFCGAGVALMMGWIPVSLGRPEAPSLAKFEKQFEKPAAPVVVAAPCTECGVVRSVRAVKAKAKGKGSNLGAVAGTKIEKRVESASSYEITVDLDDGTNRVITEAGAPAWRNGDKVRIVNGVIESNA